jgi:hypothetical protein
MEKHQPVSPRRDADGSVLRFEPAAMSNSRIYRRQPKVLLVLRLCFERETKD